MKLKLLVFLALLNFMVSPALAEEGKIEKTIVTKAMADFGIDPDKPNPVYN